MYSSNAPGNSIVIITPGNGVFEIEKNLAGITKQRMMDNGIGSDMLSLSLPPLHVAPFFLYKEKSVASGTEEERTGFDEWKTYFEVPHWMNLSFVDYDNEDQESTLYREKNIHEGEFLRVLPGTVRKITELAFLLQKILRPMKRTNSLLRIGTRRMDSRW